ncbi:MAG: RidA family protein [Oscillospiraceae bacterium]|nr:RidA family protein [Oscillospiraceae bacterium]
MMEKITTTSAPGAIGPYSQAIKAGGFLFTSGQIPLDPATGALPEGAAAQARQALTNLTNLIKASGADVKKTVKTVVFIKNMDDFAEINKVYAEFFSEPYPARSCVEVARLPKDVLIEAEAIVEL